MKRLLHTILFVVAVSMLAVIIFPVSAQIATIDPKNCTDLGLNCPGGQGSKPLIDFISKIVNWFLGLVGLLAAIVLIWGGIKYIISLGDEDSAAEAKKLILYAIVGLIVIGLAAVLVNFVIDVIDKELGNRVD